MGSLDLLNAKIIQCERCPRLVEYRRQVACTKRRAYLDWEYWGRPVPGFGDPQARLFIIGLAPAAHGANRTGRMFTGDRSGEFLYRALYETGFASQPTSTQRGDGLALRDAYISAAARCAPPDNKPTPQEFRNCRSWLAQELQLFPAIKVVVVLGRLAMDAYLTVLREGGSTFRRSALPFGHKHLHSTGSAQPALLCSYHPSQQNTSTGRLTAAMLSEVFQKAREILAHPLRY